MATFELYFSDLTETAQQSILEKAGIQDETELNWDVFPITTIEFEDNEESEDEE